MAFDLPALPALEPGVAALLARDYRRFARGLPPALEAYCRETYRIDLASRYAGLPVKNPFGKGSGQLSLSPHQVERDAAAGLGFVVLKTVIAEERSGLRSMREWATPESRMAVERIRGASGREGWTVTWAGRGWHGTLASYLDLVAGALDAALPAGMQVVPSCKYHLPRPGEIEWRTGEYEFTTRELVRVWRNRAAAPMPLEKDFSPTLAGSALAGTRGTILEWLRRVPELVRAAVAPGEVRVGLKLFNALFDDRFQVEMLEALETPGDSRPDFVVYGNRLFDPERSFEGKRGVAYGGPDLSERNLRVLAAWREAGAARPQPTPPLELSATGDIASGRTAVEYLLRGASTFQMHTIFQLPDHEFDMPSGPRTARVLHRLLFRPTEGFLAWMCHARQALGWPPAWTVSEAAEWCACRSPVRPHAG